MLTPLRIQAIPTYQKYNLCFPTLSNGQECVPANANIGDMKANAVGAVCSMLDRDQGVYNVPAD